MNIGKKSYKFIEERGIVPTLTEIELTSPEMYKIVMETLTRLGIKSNTNHTITQTAHLICLPNHKHYLLHFKEFYWFSKMTTPELTYDDACRKAKIIQFLKNWKMITPISDNYLYYKDQKLPEEDIEKIPLFVCSKTKVFEEKWELIKKVTVKEDYLLK